MLLSWYFHQQHKTNIKPFRLKCSNCFWLCKKYILDHNLVTCKYVQLKQILPSYLQRMLTFATLFCFLKCCWWTTKLGPQAPSTLWTTAMKTLVDKESWASPLPGVLVWVLNVSSAFEPPVHTHLADAGLQKKKHGKSWRGSGCPVAIKKEAGCPEVRVKQVQPRRAEAQGIQR